MSSSTIWIVQDQLLEQTLGFDKLPRINCVINFSKR